MTPARYLAFDLGAESGRAFVGTLADGRLTTEELCRFPHRPVEVRGTLYWDLLALYEHVLGGMREYVARWGPTAGGVGLDTWGVDFGLLDGEGNLLQNPVAYRDRRTEGMVEVLQSRMAAAEVFACTGVAPLSIVTACQLLSLQVRRSPLLEAAQRLLMLPDLLAYFLTGVQRGERSNAASTQLYDPRSGKWSEAMARAVGLREGLLPELVDPGTVLGEVDPEVARATGWGQGPVIAPCSHDTPSAVAAVPGEGEDWAFLSSGTWSIVGALTDEIVTTTEALAAGMSNGVTVQGQYLYRDLNGMWLLQQARAAWAAQGGAYGYDELVRRAEQSPPGGPLVEVGDPGFLAPRDMLEALGSFCRGSGQTPPADPGAVTRCLLESLALAYREVLEQLARVLGRSFRVLHVVGGGSSNALLCQWTANTTGLPVIAGPVETTVCGNLLTQAYARGALGSGAEIRQVVRRSFELQDYLPKEIGYWEDRYGAYRDLREAST